MAEIIRKTIIGYNYLFDYLSDPVTKSWPLVAKPYEGLTILALYLLFVFKWGPKWMEHRQPYNLDKIIIVYNALQVFLCAYLFFDSFNVTKNYKWLCEPIDYSDSTQALNIRKLCYYYYLMKYLDLADTIFFVLRKKFKQISFLHVYHHTGMVMLVWGATTYLPGGHGTSIGVINSFVHMVMYFYYLLTVAVPKIKESIWWKKHVTQIQIIQFFLCVVHMGSIIFVKDCAYPKWTVTIFLPQNLFMLILFIDFYIKTYVKKSEKETITEKKREENNGVSKSSIDGKQVNGIQNILENRSSDNMSIRQVKRS